MLRIFVGLSYLGVILINFLANSLPFNNTTTGDISNKYQTLFTPSGLTFSIWGVIYLLLGVYVFKVVFQNETFENDRLVMILFVVSSVFNALWLVAWHYDRMFLSTLIMLALFSSLFVIFMIIPSSAILAKSAFTMYFAWICVATIANISILLFKIDLSVFVNNDTLWFILVISIGSILALVTLHYEKNVMFGAVFCWAYFGILFRHIVKEGNYINDNFVLGYNGVLLVLIIMSTIYTFVQNGNKFYA